MISSVPTGADHKGWAMVAPTHSLQGGMLKGTQIHHDITAKDSVIEFCIDSNGPHCGHLRRARIAVDRITPMHQKGLSVAGPGCVTFEPPAPAGRRDAAFPFSLDSNARLTFMMEAAGDIMRATIEAKALALLQSPGIAHPTISKIEFGRTGWVDILDDLKIWNAEPGGVNYLDRSDVVTVDIGTNAIYR